MEYTKKELLKQKKEIETKLANRIEKLEKTLEKLSKKGAFNQLIKK